MINDTESSSTRDRILRAARHLFQQRGYAAVGTAEILAAANAPKGSMYHHFPEGKEAIAIAAVYAIRDDLTAMVNKLIAKQLPVDAIIRTMAKGMAAWLKASEWREGAMLTATVIGSVPDRPKLHDAIRETFAAWREQLASRLIDEGHSKNEASTLARTLIAGLEGAMILARIEQDERVVIKVADTLTLLTKR